MEKEKEIPELRVTDPPKELYEAISKEAKKEDRTIPKQIVHDLKKVYGIT